MNSELLETNFEDQLVSDSKLICLTDFSPNSEQAAIATAALAARMRAPMVLLHITSGIPAPREIERLLDASPKALRKKLKNEAEKLAVSGATIQGELLTGEDVHHALAEFMAKNPAALSVVSASGKRALDRWTLGSVSENVAEYVPTPTLVVRSSEPFLDWTEGVRPLRVVVAFDFTTTSEAALSWVKNLKDIGECELVVVYVDWPPAERARLGLTEPMPLDRNTPRVQAILERDLKARAAELLGSSLFRIRIEANWGRPDARLNEIAKEEKADLIVVGSHQQRGFERLLRPSVSRGLLHNSNISIAVVPTSARRNCNLNTVSPVRRVIVPTDFSKLANMAIPHALNTLAGAGIIHLVHVVHPHAISGNVYLQSPADHKSRLRHKEYVDACAQKLRALLPVESLPANIELEVEVVEHRDPAKAIGEAAERFGTHLICIASHGRSGLSKAVLGSVAQSLMKQSKRPLLVVRAPED